VLAGGVAEALARTAAQLRDDDEALDAAAAELLAQACRNAELAVSKRETRAPLDASVLAGAPAAVRRRALRSWLAVAGVIGLTDGHLRAADDLVGRWHGQGAVALPQRLELVRERGRLRVRTAAWPRADRRVPPQPIHNRPAPEPPGGSSVYDGDIASVLITEDEVRDKIAELARQVGKDYAESCTGTNDLLLVGVLKGAVMFMTDFARALPLPVQLEFMAVSSYGSSTSSSGVVRILKDLDRDIAGRHVLIVEDIIDSGLTLSWLLKNLESRQPASLEVCTLLRKPDAVTVDVPVRYVGFDIPNEFVVGFGLDYAERYRDLPFIGTLDPAVYS
jgi:hypoxanthine phosphoribosyltransferase